MLGALRRGPVRSAADASALCVCGAPLLARYDLTAAKRWPQVAARRRAKRRCGGTAKSCRCSQSAKGIDPPVTLGEGWTPLLRARRLGDDARAAAASTSRTKASIPPGRSRPRGVSAAVTRALHLGARGLDRRRRRARRPGGRRLRGAGRRCRPQVFVPHGRAAAVRAREPSCHGAAVTTRRRRPGRGRTRGARPRRRRRVRHVGVPRAVPPRGQEDDRLRDSPSSWAGRCRTGSSARSASGAAFVGHLEGVRRDGGARLDRSGAPAASGGRAGGRMRADRPRRRRQAAERTTPWDAHAVRTLADDLRVPTRRRLAGAARHSRERRRGLGRGRRRDGGGHEDAGAARRRQRRARRRRGAARRCACWPARAASSRTTRS